MRSTLFFVLKGSSSSLSPHNQWRTHEPANNMEPQKNVEQACMPGGHPAVIPIDTELFPKEAPRCGDVVELHGPEGCGKSEMLLRLIARCILPRYAGGSESYAVLLDCDLHFDFLRFVALLERMLKRQAAQPSSPPLNEGGAGDYAIPNEPREEDVCSCLTRFSIASCHSSSQLLLTLSGLEAGGAAALPRLRLLAVDGLSAFYWIDRAPAMAPGAGQAITTLQRCCSLLGRLAAAHPVVVVATTQSLFKAPSGSPHQIFLCKGWNSLVSYQFQFERSVRDDRQFILTLFHVTRGLLYRRSFTITAAGIQLSSVEQS
uniref:DNA repair protein XRCC2 isoform X2 n=1 Tax=Myxine glutinosa TaxID=7769 RepID=UPI00358EA2B8